MIKRFVRVGKKDLRKIGVLVADIRNGKIVIGHSKWNRKLDDYNPKLGNIIALNRMNTDSKQAPALSIARDYLSFVGRAQRYFKNTELSDNTKKACAKAEANIMAQKLSHKAPVLGDVETDLVVGC